MSQDRAGDTELLAPRELPLQVTRALGSGSALDSTHNKHLSLPGWLPGAVLRSGLCPHCKGVRANSSSSCREGKGSFCTSQEDPTVFISSMSRSRFCRSWLTEEKMSKRHPQESQETREYEVTRTPWEVSRDTGNRSQGARWEAAHNQSGQKNTGSCLWLEGAS